MKLQPAALLTAFAVLFPAGACKSDDAGGSKSPQQPAATVAGAPGLVDGVNQPPPAAPAARRAGPVTPEERQARRDQARQKYDTNGDGRLNKEERAAMQTAMLDRRMSRIDADGDGKISRDEAGQRPIGRRLLADFDSADVNHDSFVSREELDSAVKVLQQQRREARARGDLEGDAAAEQQAPPAAAPGTP